MGPRERHPLVVCEAHPGHGEDVAAELVSYGYEVRCCGDEEALIEAVSERHPSAVVYELHHQLPVDLAILVLVRRLLPDVPLVLIAHGHETPTVRALRTMQPAVLAHEPVDREGLRAAVRRAVRRARERLRAQARAALSTA